MIQSVIPIVETNVEEVTDLEQAPAVAPKLMSLQPELFARRVVDRLRSNLVSASYGEWSVSLHSERTDRSLVNLEDSLRRLCRYAQKGDREPVGGNTERAADDAAMLMNRFGALMFGAFGAADAEREGVATITRYSEHDGVWNAALVVCEAALCRCHIAWKMPVHRTELAILAGVDAAVVRRAVADGELHDMPGEAPRHGGRHTRPIVPESARSWLQARGVF